MKAIVSVSIASFAYAYGGGFEYLAPVAILSGLFSYLWFERLKITPRQRQMLDNYVIIFLFFGICAFVWFCVYRIYTKGLLF